jgi:DNA invertase Pin-like site-specific DNA recombinase
MPIMSEKLRLVGYVRQSVANGGDSLEAQADAIRAWAKAEGHRIVASFEDDGISGTLDETERPGLSLALAMLEDGEADGIIVHRLDRLARRLHVSEAIFAKVWRWGGHVFAVDGGEVIEADSSDPMRVFVRQVLGATAELERNMVVARVQRGRQRAAEQGRYLGGSIPYGYRLADDRKTLVEIPEEQALVKRIRKLAEKLRHEDGTPKVREIARAVERRPEFVRRILTRAPGSPYPADVGASKEPLAEQRNRAKTGRRAAS